MPMSVPAWMSARTDQRGTIGDAEAGAHHARDRADPIELHDDAGEHARLEQHPLDDTKRRAAPLVDEQRLPGELVHLGAPPHRPRMDGAAMMISSSRPTSCTRSFGSAIGRVSRPTSRSPCTSRSIVNRDGPLRTRSSTCGNAS
jgi:hypothetical protein